MRYITKVFILILFFQKLVSGLEYYPSLHQSSNYDLIGAKEQFKLLHGYTSQSGSPLPLSAETSLIFHAELDENDNFCVDNWSHMKLYIPSGTTSFKVVFTTRTNTNYRINATFKALDGTINQIENSTKIAFSENILNQFTVQEHIVNIGSLSLSDEDMLKIGNGGWLYIDLAGDTAIRPSAYYNNYNATIAIAPKYVIGDTNAFNNWLANTTFKTNGDPIDDVNEITITNNTCKSGVESYKINLNEGVSTTSYPKYLTFDSIHQTKSSIDKIGVLQQYLDNNKSLQITAYQYDLDESIATNDSGECVSKRQYMKMYIPGGTELFSLDFSSDDAVNQKILFKFGSDSDMDLSTSVPFSIENLKTHTIYNEISGHEKVIFSNLDSLIGESGGWLYISAINASDTTSTGYLSLSLSINNQEIFEKWLTSTKFTSNGDPSEISANSTMNITDNYCDDGIQESILSLNQSGSLYDPNIGEVAVDEHEEAKQNCIASGGSWIEGANVCDGGQATTPVSSSSSSQTVSSSGSSSSVAAVDNSKEEAKQSCIASGGSWIEGANVCDGGQTTSTTPVSSSSSSQTVSSSGSSSSVAAVDNSKEEAKQSCIASGGSWIEGANVCDAPEDTSVDDTSIIDKITNNTYDVKGHFTHYEDSWYYSTPSGRLIAKVDGEKDGKIHWDEIYRNENISYAHYSEQNKQITFNSNITEKNISGKTINISGYIIRYENSRFGWIYTSRDGNIIASLKGIDTEGKLIWEYLNNIENSINETSVVFLDNHTSIRFETP